MTFHKNHNKLVLVILMSALVIQGCAAPSKSQIDPNQFSIDQCNCSGVYIPLNEGSSSASNSTYPTTISSGEEIEINGSLRCNWQEDYKSKEKTGIIRASLEVTKVHIESQAKALYKIIKKDLLEKPAYCADDESCTVTVEEYGPERSYYAEENIYGITDEVFLPSYHIANLARNIYGRNYYYVVNIAVDHPELDPGDTFVTDTALAIEACLKPLTE